MTTSGFVYTFYDTERTPLYVGCTYKPGTRIDQHHNKPWWGQVAFIEVERFQPYDAARIAERARIESLQPEHNVAYTARSAQYATSELTVRLVNADLALAAYKRPA